jgi:hypothetical protein
VDYLWLQLLRAGNLTPVHYGEDEGSQRSGETLKTRFWPSRVVSHIQRIYWRAGLAQLAKHMLNMCAVLQIEIEGKTLPLHISRAYNIRAEFPPMVARDREALVSEIVQLAGVNRQSIDEALRKMGDVEDIDAEIDTIMAELQRMKSLDMEQAQQTAPSPTPNNQNG